MRTLTIFALILFNGEISPWALATDVVCVQELDSSRRLNEVATLTLNREIARIGGDVVQKMLIEGLYQAAYQDLIRDLTSDEIEVVDLQIKSEIERVQRLDKMKAEGDRTQEASAREGEDHLFYGPDFLFFEKLALKEGNSSQNFRQLFNAQTLKSFQYQPFQFPEGGTTVVLGNPASIEEQGSYEGVYEVKFTKSFEMQATPVTQLQWALVMGENPSGFKSDSLSIKVKGRDIPLHPNHPVEQIFWADTQKFIERLNQLDRRYNYRLPTEAEWEYAARAGTDTAYSFGENEADLRFYGWYNQNSGGRTHDVAGMLPNPNGLYDMHGNVSQWVQNWYEAVRPAYSVDPTGPLAEMTGMISSSWGLGRTIRGGSWQNSASFLRSTWRGAVRNFARDTVGLRLVRMPR